MYLFASFLFMLVFFSSSIFFFKRVGSCRESALEPLFLFQREPGFRCSWNETVDSSTHSSDETICSGDGGLCLEILSECRMLTVHSSRDSLH